MFTVAVTVGWAANPVFYESFDQCAGTGGNDGSWSGNIASSTAVYDNVGWEVISGSGGNKCLKSGTGKISGQAITPAITVESGKAYVLSFKAGAWNASSEKTGFTLSAAGGALSGNVPTELNKGQFDAYSVTFTASSAEAKFTFAAAGRFFLDEVTLTESDGTEPGPEPVTVAAPTFSPAAGEVEAGTLVTISQPEAALIVYTIDGTTPSYANNVGNVYESPIAINEVLTIRAIAVDDDENESEVAEAAYTIKQIEPMPDPVTGSKFQRINSVADLETGYSYLIVCEDNATTWLNTRSQTTDFTLANGVATLPDGSKIKQFVLGGAKDAYTLVSGTDYLQWTSGTQLAVKEQPTDATVAQWKITFSGNEVFIENANSARKIFAYNNDSGPLDFRAYAAATNSTHDIQLYKVITDETPVDVVADPVYDPEGGTYTKAVTVTITSETEGAEIYYALTDDYSYPNVINNPTLYTGPITLDASGYYWLNAYAMKDGVKSGYVENYYLLEISDVQSQAEPPVIMPNGGNFDGELTVSISAGGETDMIIYTLDGTDPSFDLGNGIDYEGEFTINKSTVVKAVALDPDAVPTDIVKAEFFLNPAGAPVFTPADGTTFQQGETLNVKITSTNSIDIFYTLDGSEPSLENEAAIGYTEDGIDITATTTIKAIAYNNDVEPSEISVATYTMEGDEPQPGSEDYARINKVSDLAVDGQYLIVCEEKETSVKNSKDMTSNITLNNGIATLPEGSDVNEYVLGGEAGAYTLSVGDDYLQCGASGTTLSFKAIPDDATLAQWDITFDGNDVVLTNVNTGRHILAYQDRDFRAYKDSGSSEVYNIQLYKKGAELDTTIVVPTVVGIPVISPAGGEITEDTEVTITAGENGVAIAYVLGDAEEEVITETEVVITVPVPEESVTLTAYSVAEDGTRSEAATVIFTAKKEEPQPEVQDTKYVRINATTDLTVGEKFILVCEETGNSVKNSNTQVGELVINDGVANLYVETTVNEYVLGGEEGAYTLSVGDNYLQANASGTGLSLSALPESEENANLALWQITFDGNNAIIVNVANERQIFAYQNTFFRAYIDPGANLVYPVQLYKQEGEEPVGLVGDVNNDGSVNAGDVSAIYNVMLGVETDEGIIERADVNGDGSVNAGDVSNVYSIMLGGE